MSPTEEERAALLANHRPRLQLEEFLRAIGAEALIPDPFLGVIDVVGIVSEEDRQYVEDIRTPGTAVRYFSTARQRDDYLAGIQNEPTPSARWRAEGRPDPHGRHYDRERSALPCGDFTDDEIANAAFLHPENLIFLTAAKERIRWLSRALERALAGKP